MTIQIRRNPNDRICELGGGESPVVHPKCQGGSDINVDVRMCNDAQGNPTVDFTADFNEPLPISGGEFDCVVSVFALEHVSWRKTRQFISEIHRILKPGGRVFIVIPNTEAQVKYIQSHPDGWEDRDLFTSASVTLFGDQNHVGNFHSAYFSPSVATQLFSEAGFENILTSPYGAIGTDMVLEAVKPQGVPVDSPQQELANPIPQFPEYKGPNVSSLSTEGRASLFGREYFNGGAYQPFQWDVPQHELMAQQVLQRKPSSVIELGCGRGYLGKRIQDAGVPWFGLDISPYAKMTRVVFHVDQWDLCRIPWKVQEKGSDLCLSVNFLPHIPEEFLPGVIREMERVSHRALHAIDFQGNSPDRTRCTVRPGEWWVELFNRVAPDYPVEICPTQTLQQGELPREFLQGDGRTKLNLGSYMTCFHHGWVNIDQHDLGGWAQQHGYKFQRLDIRQGLPYGTGVVDFLFLSHCLEHFTREEGVSLLRECRRVIRPDGVMRILVPDGELLMRKYLNGSLGNFDVMDEKCQQSPTGIGKLWALLHENHQTGFDEETLCLLLREVGFQFQVKSFREGNPQLLRETLEMGYELSLVCEAVPMIG